MDFSSWAETVEHDRMVAAETKRLPGAALDQASDSDLDETPTPWVDDRIARAARRALGLDP